ncbi:MAG: glycosyltransferase, partial [Verrucomicrobiota bacterium]
MTWPFKEGVDSPRGRGHTNAFEVVAMAETYRELGYRVEVTDHDDHFYIPPKDCSVVIDLHGQLERWAPFLPKKCRRILHATTAHWLQANESALRRLSYLRDRKGVALFPRRQVEPSSSVALADEIVVLGNEHTTESFRFANKPITRIPISSAYEFPWPKERDFSQAKKNFLWLGSYGMAHKGLDLLLEAFAQMPELSLTVCGRPEKEKDFFELYKKELTQTSNIHLHGWINMGSPEFLKLARTHAAIIYPSCSEGGGGSVIHCMHAGMVPLCTREASVDLEDFGILIKEGTVEGVIEAMKKFVALADNEVEQCAMAAYEHVRRHHTREQFQKNYSAFAKNLLS